LDVLFFDAFFNHDHLRLVLLLLTINSIFEIVLRTLFFSELDLLLLLNFFFRLLLILLLHYIYLYI
jgi:hypothetical protein